MKKEVLVKMINSLLRNPWSEEEIKHGKDIHCMPAWTNALKIVIPLYAENGWIITKELVITSKSRQLSLNFKHPKWHKKQ